MKQCYYCGLEYDESEGWYDGIGWICECCDMETLEDHDEDGDSFSDELVGYLDELDDEEEY